MNGGLTVLLLLVPALAVPAGGRCFRRRFRADVALFVSLATLLVALIMACEFNYSCRLPAIQIHGLCASSASGRRFRWGSIRFRLWLVLLTVLLMPLAIAGQL